MKVYQLTEDDFKKLDSALIEVERNKLKEHYLSAEKVQLAEDIYRSFNYYIKRWIQEVKE